MPYAGSELIDWTRRMRRFRGLLTIVGSSKNAGKTTVLNYLLRKLDPAGLAVTSVGRDGERLDVLNRCSKPSIRLRRGVLFATAQGCLERSEGDWEAVRHTGLGSPLGPVHILRASSECRVELAGPSGVEQLAEVSGALRRLGASRILVDGAFDRSAAASARVCDGLILALGCDGKNDVAEALREWSAWLERFRLPSPKADRPMVRLRALTDDLLPELKGQSIVLPDPSCCLVEPAHWNWIRSGKVKVFFERRISLEGVFLSSFRAFAPPLPAGQLLDRMRELHPGERIFDLQMEGELGAI